jgi:hypothetical protein
MNNLPADTKEIIKKFQYVKLNNQTDSVTKCLLLQQMNYNVSQLPMAAKCPDAPLPLPSKSFSLKKQ